MSDEVLFGDEEDGSEPSSNGDLESRVRELEQQMQQMDFENFQNVYSSQNNDQVIIEVGKRVSLHKNYLKEILSPDQEGGRDE